MREKILLDDNWLFHLGDIKYNVPTQKAPIYTEAKTERFHHGPAARAYTAVEDDYDKEHELNMDMWENVDLPHDYIIGQEPKKENNNCLGFFKYENAWYRKNFSLTPEDRNKRLSLYFEGIATYATVYLNGCLLKHNFCGYTSFEVDITDYADFDRENILAVYVDNTSCFEGWWYQGGGIYRDVWLMKTDLVSVDLYGLYVKPQKQGEHWSVTVENTLRNDRYEQKNVTVKTDIIDGGKTVLSMTAGLELPSRKKTVAVLKGVLDNPHLWSIEDPHRYIAKTTVVIDGESVDCAETKFGFRYYDFIPGKGLFLNGKKIFINGLCSHGDFGLTGKAVPDNIQRHKVKIMKQMGANGFRCSHYPHSEATMDALDETGFVVMAETRWFESTSEGIEQLEMLVKRDRNRPSILFWSVGNEEPKFATESGRRICENMINCVRRLDDTRMIICAVDLPDKSTVYDSVDAVAINYNLQHYDEVHKKYPDKMIIASECCATSSTRGWYYDDNPQKGYYNAFDKDSTPWFRGRENTWSFLRKRDYVAGAYQWTAFEHRGECVWPRLSSQSGAIDLYLQKKDAYYLNQALFTEDKPILHLFPHWNFEGREGEVIPVGVYTNCDEVELFLNGKSVERKAVEKYGDARFFVPYCPGEIRAVGYKSGVPVAEDKRITAGAAVKLVLKEETEPVCANGRDIALLTCFCVDENGLEVPDCTPFVSFASNALGKIVGTGSDICDHSPVTNSDRRMRAGRISVAVRVGNKHGTLKIYAEAENLKSALLEIEI